MCSLVENRWKIWENRQKSIGYQNDWFHSNDQWHNWSHEIFSQSNRDWLSLAQRHTKHTSVFCKSVSHEGLKGRIPLPLGLLPVERHSIYCCFIDKNSDGLKYLNIFTKKFSAVLLHQYNTNTFQYYLFKISLSQSLKSFGFQPKDQNIGPKLVDILKVWQSTTLQPFEL